MKKEFQIERQGKTFVLYAGLLDAAHAAGLEKIETYLVQAPSEENGETTIVRAEVTLVTAEKGIRVFSGIGDATPTNVGRNIAPHAIRMAETRAKARALRDALNIGAAALEELGGDDEPSAAAKPARKPTAEREAAILVQTPLPAAKGLYEADELRAFRRQGKAPANLESAAERFVQGVKDTDPQRFAAFSFGDRKGTVLLDWLIEATAKWDASPENPRHPAAAAV